MNSLRLGFGIRLKLDLSGNRLIWGVCSVNNRLISVNFPPSKTAKLLRFIAFFIDKYFLIRQKTFKKCSANVLHYMKSLKIVKKGLTHQILTKKSQKKIKMLLLLRRDLFEF